eukprot:7470411-Pyramimonas_sp.AAC.1
MLSGKCELMGPTHLGDRVFFAKCCNAVRQCGQRGECVCGRWASSAMYIRRAMSQAIAVKAARGGASVFVAPGRSWTSWAKLLA